VKINTASTIGHLQRSRLDFREDSNTLIRKLRNRAEFIPTPFTEWNNKRFDEYQSPYRKGRANVLAIGGPTASGKTTLMKQIFGFTDDWSEKIRATKLLDGYYSKKLNTWILGVYEDSVGTFQGMDKLSKSVPPQLVNFISENAANPVNILFEGANVVTVKTLGNIIDCNVNFVLLRLMVSNSLKQTRHRVRADNQKDKFIKAKETQIENVASNPKIFDSVVEVRNDNSVDRKIILQMISWFLKRSTY
jgi:ABC-type dipeptide/oligopeptide/nickel transport system ATPase subunit